MTARGDQFPQAAAESLAPVAGRVEDAKQSAESGQVTIDFEAARELVRRIDALQRRAKALWENNTDLDTKLRFGENWVGGLMSMRFNAAAENREVGVKSVLWTFARVLGDLEATVRLAAGLYERSDEEAAIQLRLAAERIGVQIVSGVR